MNLVLIGYRGTGKSTVAALLSKTLGMPVMSLDALIERRAGCRIREFVAANGWDAFRDVESAVCAEVCEQDNQIIDAGGGAILRPENVAALRRNGFVVWLRATRDTIAARIGSDDNRPSLTESKTFVDEIADVMRERHPLYERAADFVVDTDNRDTAGVASIIDKQFRNHVAARGTRP